ncbi:helix-turn-helix domain-containing protein [Desertivirga arenae]|uniref:helix-turn-helix domain-containing protein n=1 Tax=Desertivirga arenae TaxID=2810309 RepID=UPI001A95A9E9|nr:AraC family transcriptional regulator [Pedobacter sp. SYSU D00823]
MKVFRQFDPLLVDDVKETSFTCSHHSHTYYEIVYIHSGEGQHLFNNDKVAYTAGDLFLIAPGDQHSFQIQEPTHFTYIKFTEAYFESKKHLSPDEFKVGSPEILMEMKWLKDVKIELYEPCREILHATINNIILYSSYRELASSPIVYYQLLSIFGIIREVLKSRNNNVNKAELNFEKLLSYLHENIYDREKLLVRNVSAYFHISVTYFSNYFKRNFGISYQDYLDNYRVMLIEKRLAVGGLKLKEIAREFGFTDVSHLSKAFKRVKGVTPKKYEAKS